MMSVKCVRIRLIDGGGERAREWAREINARRPEALATLQQEGVNIESVFIEQLEGVDYLIYYMRAVDMAKALEAGVTISDDLQQYHRKFQKETWQSGAHLELLVDLELPNS